MSIRKRSPWIGAAVAAAAIFLPMATPAAVRLDRPAPAGPTSVSGTLECDGVRVHYESRETPGGVESRIFSTTGEVLTEVVIDEVSGTLVYRIAGAEISERVQDPGPDEYRRAFDRPEASLVASGLWRDLEARGIDLSSRAVAALAVNLVGYEALLTPETQAPSAGSCLGCCGPGCFGCTGCYTAACLAHDLCVMAYGGLAPQCNSVVYLAALSAWCCRGVDLGSLC